MQIGAITGVPFRRKGTDDLLARLGLLPQIMAQKSQAEYNDAMIDDMEKRRQLEEQQFGIQKDQMKFQRDQANKVSDLREQQEGRAMGIQAFGLGANMIGSDIWNNIKSGVPTQTTPVTGGASEAGLAAGMTPAQASSPSTVASATPASFFQDLPWKSVLGGGALGFAGSRLGGSNKFMRVGLGTGLGALGGYFGGGGWSGAMGGGLLGGLGGLF